MSGALDLKTRWQVGRVHPTPESEPKGWTLRRLCDVAKLESGHTPSRKRPDYWGGGIPWLSLHDSKEIEGKEIFHTQHTISKLGLDNSSARLLPKGTVALSRTATIGKVAILGGEMATSQDFACYVCGPDLFNHYLAQLFRGMETEWDRLMAGSTHNTIYMPLFESMQVLVPPLPEQQAIAAALSDADGVVAGLERVIAKKRLIKQGAMQDLLTARRRLPGFSGEWEVQRLAQLGDVKTGLTYKPENVKPFGTLVLRSSNIQNDRLAFDNNVFVDVAVPDEATVREGDLLICVRNGSRQLIGKTAMIDARADGMAFGAFMSAFRSEINDYLLWCFQSAVVQDQIAENLGATINQITNKTMKAIEIRLPKDEKERQAIAAVLSDMDTEIQTLESRLTKARAVKEGMMQNLLTGRVRLV